MKFTRDNRNEFLRAARSARAGARLLVAALGALFAAVASLAPAQAPTTTTVTGTVYLANGQPGTGTLVLSWPSFTTAAGQVVAADSLTVTIPSDGFVSVSLAPNQGATPAGEYYTAVFYMSDGSTSTQYWTVPAAAGATLAAVQAQIMPAAQAVQTVSKAYVDQAISELSSGGIASSGGTLTGPLYLSSDPTAPLQAADKHYVDTEVAAGSGSGTVNSGTTSQIAYYNANGATVAGSAATVSSGGAGAFAGLDDTASPNLPSYLESGSDEGTRLQNAINAFISSPGAGRAISESVPARQTAVTWATNPFAALLNANGSVNVGNVYQLAVQVQPWQTVSTQAEIDLGQYAQVDCGDVYSAYDPALGKAGIIQPDFPAWSSTTTYSMGQFASAGGVNYVSLQAANLNQAPASQPTFWAAATAMMTMGPFTGATATTIASQGSKISNCGLYNNGASGMTGILDSAGQEGTKLSNLRITDFMVGIDVSNLTGSTGGSMHNFGIYDTQVEMNDGVDAKVWGVRYGFSAPTVEPGVLENISTIGGTNPTGNTKIGIEDDGNQLLVRNQLCESLTVCLLINNLHSGRKDGSHYDGITMAAANAPVFAIAEDAGASADSYFLDEVTAGDVASNIFVDKEQPTAAIEKLAGEISLSEYVRSTPATGIHAQPVIWTTTAQAASVNGPSGDSFENGAAWPFLLLPAKLVSITFSGQTYTGAQFMTASDKTAGVLPFGIALNGDLSAATSSTPHAVSVARRGIGSCIFDGATTANDVVVLSGSAVYGSAIGCHDSASSSLPSSGVYLGYVRKSVAGIPATPSAPTATTSCTSACSTTYSYEWVMRNSEDPFDRTQSAPSSAGSVSGPSVLTTSSGGANQGSNTITAPSGCSFTTPCDLYRTVGGTTGFVGEYHATSNVPDQGMTGNGLLPTASGILAPPVDLLLGTAGAATLASSSAPGLAQCDGTTITCSSGILSTAAGSILSHWWNGGGMLTASTQYIPVSTANTQYPQDVEIPVQVNFSRMCVDVTTADATSGDVYNLALVKLTTPTCTGASCATTTVANWSAPTALSATGLTCAANAQGSVTLTPGAYYLISTGNANAARIAAVSSSASTFSSLTSGTQAGTSSGGTFGTITLNVLANGAVVNSGASADQVAFGLTQ